MKMYVPTVAVVYEGVNELTSAIVGALYERPPLRGINEMRAVIDRPYRRMQFIHTFYDRPHVEVSTTGAVTASSWAMRPPNECPTTTGLGSCLPPDSMIST